MLHASSSTHRGPSGSNEFILAAPAVAAALALGLTETDLLAKLRRATRITWEGANYRYGDLGFDLWGNVLMGVVRLNPLDKPGRTRYNQLMNQRQRRFLVWDTCGDCEGRGCDNCIDGQQPTIREA